MSAQHRPLAASAWPLCHSMGSADAVDGTGLEASDAIEDCYAFGV